MTFHFSVNFMILRIPDAFKITYDVMFGIITHVYTIYEEF